MNRRPKRSQAYRPKDDRFWDYISPGSCRSRIISICSSVLWPYNGRKVGSITLSPPQEIVSLVPPFLRGGVADVFVLLALDLAGAHRKGRMEALEGLDARLLVG